MLAFGPLRECCMAYAVTTGSTLPTLGPTSKNVVHSWSPTSTPLSNLSYHNMAHATRLCNCARVYVIFRNFAGFEGRVVPRLYYTVSFLRMVLILMTNLVNPETTV